ncbi:MAG TPA: MXAN_5187 family protein, partial [Kofleriaceae bacterium]|nr:MXAN_5187 family protein [Kofleriaceae bacterium]
RVAAAPVVNREVGVRDRYAGAVVLGHPIDKDLAASLASQVRFNISFYVAGQAVANSTTEQLHKDMLDEFERIKGADRDRVADCAENKPFMVSSGPDAYAALLARLPGEAAEQGAFYSVYVKRPKGVGFLGTLDAVDGKDLSFGNFPWIAVGLVLVLAVGLGMFLMVWESDRPLRKLADDAVLLAKGETERLQEDKHRGKFGSIARSVNIQLDKQERESKAAKKDLDQLLGPAPEDSLAGAPNPLPSMGPGGFGGRNGGGDFKPPPPSEFKFKDSSANPARAGGGGFDLDLPPPPPPAPSPGARPPAPPTLARPTDARVPPPPVGLPKTPAPPPPVPRRSATPPPLAAAGIDDDILGATDDLDDDLDDSPTVGRPPSDFDAPTRVADPSRALLEQSADGGPSQEAAFQRVFDDFLTLKKKCGESTANLTFDKFTAKLKKNRQALMSKHGCKEVKFQVYIKDGRAALKATPVKP